MEYKLIPYPNQEGEWLIISDETLKINDFYCNFKDKKIVKSESDWINFGDGELKCAKIYFTTKFIDKSISLIRKEQLVFPHKTSKIAEDFINDGIDGYPNEDDTTGKWMFDKLKENFIAGYNNHAETHPFTLEDMKRCWENGVKWGDANCEFAGETLLPKFPEYIKSLKQPKKEYIVELGMEYYSKPENGYSAIHKDQRPKIDSEGYINILKINNI